MSAPDLQSSKRPLRAFLRKMLKGLGLCLGFLATAFGIVQFLGGTPTLNDFMIATGLRDTQRFTARQVARITGAPACDLLCADFWLRDETGHYVRVVDPNATFSIVSAGSTNSDCRAVAETLTIIEDAFEPYLKISTYYIALDTRIDNPENARYFRDTYELSTHVLTGTPREIEYAAKSLRVFFERYSSKDAPYGFNHSGTIYVFDNQGRFITGISHATPTADVAKLLISEIENSTARKIERRAERAETGLSAGGLFGIAHAEGTSPNAGNSSDGLAANIATAIEHRQKSLRIPPCDSMHQGFDG